MSRSTELFERSLKVTPGGVHSPVRAFKSVGGQPLFFERAQGAYIYSVEGDPYIDFCQSFGPNILGHRDPDVLAAVHEVVDQAWSLGTCEPFSLELAELMTKSVKGLEKIRFTSSGTEAVMSALRVARAATGRDLILKFEGCYHGHVDSMLVKAGSGLAGTAASDSAGVPKSMAELTLVAPLNDLSAVEKIFADFGDRIAAVILEPLPANFGLLIQEEDYIRGLCDLAWSCGSLVIFDEVISGFRVALGGMSERLGIQPDLMTYGKVIGGGFPVGCYGGRAELMDQVAPQGPVYQAGTLSASPVGMRAGLATLKKVIEHNIYDDLHQRSSQFAGKLNQALADQDLPYEVSEYCSLFWLHKKTIGPIHSLKDISEGHGEVFKKVFHSCLKQGLYLAPSGFEVGFVSHAHTADILDEACAIIVKSVKEAHGL